MKKIIAVILALITVAVLFASCGTAETKNDETTTNEVTEEVTEETENKPEETADNTKSNSIEIKAQIDIEGDTFTLPMKISDFLAMGWELTDYKPEDTIKTKDRFLADAKKGEVTIGIVLNNDADQDMPCKDCKMNQIGIYSGDCKATIPGGFELDKATKDEVVSVWGEPDDEYDSCINYKIGTDENLFYELDFEGGTLCHIALGIDQ